VPQKNDNRKLGQDGFPTSYLRALEG